MKPAVILSSVVFPDPEGPTNAVNSPSLISISTSFNAFTTSSPSPKILNRFFQELFGYQKRQNH